MYTQKKIIENVEIIGRREMKGEREQGIRYMQRDTAWKRHRCSVYIIV